jgi:6-phosphogluconate dehydrogenase
MVPAAVVESVIGELKPLLARGDVLIDGGNSNYRDDIRRADELAAAGIRYLDVGTSDGVLGFEQGYCLMIGGEADAVALVKPALAKDPELANFGGRWLTRAKGAGPWKRPSRWACRRTY